MCALILRVCVSFWADTQVCPYDNVDIYSVMKFLFFILLSLILPSPLFADSSSFSNADKDRSREASPYHAKEVRNTITKRQKILQTCYLNFLKTKSEKTDGTLHLDWMIKPDGHVKDVEVISSELDNKLLSKCLTSEISKWKFPPSPTEKPTYV